MAKQKDKSSMKLTGLGILQGLNDLENNSQEEDTIPEKTDKNNYVKEQENKSSLEQKSEPSLEQKNKSSVEQKSKPIGIKKKRSFILTEEQIEMIYLLKARNHDEDLSEIVGKAIEMYYEANK